MSKNGKNKLGGNNNARGQNPHLVILDDPPFIPKEQPVNKDEHKTETTTEVELGDSMIVERPLSPYENRTPKIVALGTEDTNQKSLEPAPANDLEIKITSDFKLKEKDPVENAFNIYIETITQTGTAGEKMIVQTMDLYIQTMDSGAPLTQEQIVREQIRLYGMFKNIGRRTDDFRKTVVAARAYFKQYANTVFHDTKINRGHEVLPLNADDRKAFFSYLQFYKILASVNDLKDVNKLVVVNRSLNNPVIPAEVLERYIALIN